MRDQDFINEYLHACGTSEVPKLFSLFAGLSCLAASVANRVWLVRDASGHKIYPNIFVFLIGPSGSGKEKAITNAAKLVSELPHVGLFMSTGVTKQFLIDHLSRKPTAEDEFTNLMYLVTEELGMSIPSKELGRDLIKFMTGHYIPSGLTSHEGTRMHGQKVLSSVCLNWLAGSTDEWLTQSVEKDAIMGGFFARVLSVRGKRDGSVRHADMEFPPDYAKVKADLKLRLEMYSRLNAQFVRTPEAAAYYRNWYEDHTLRPSPTDPLMEAAFNRTDEMVHRLAMLLKLSSMDDVPTFFCNIPVDACHFEEAIKMWLAIVQDVPETIKRAASTRDSEDVHGLEDVVRRYKLIDHSTLLRRASNRGMNANRVDRVMRELIDRGDVKPDLEPTGPVGRTKRVYKWIGS